MKKACAWITILGIIALFTSPSHGKEWKISLMNKSHFSLKFYIDGEEKCTALPERDCSTTTTPGKHLLGATTESGIEIAEGIFEVLENNAEWVVSRIARARTGIPLLNNWGGFL